MSYIPKILLQISKEPYPVYLKNMWNERTDQYWKIEWFDDDKMIKYFIDNPLDEFPNIINVFNSFEKGVHKTDIFRYYFLYINGGVFVDSDVMINRHLNYFLQNNEYFFTLVDYKKNDIKNNIGDCFNGFFGCISKSPILYDLLKISYNVKPKHLDRMHLYLTTIMYNVIKKYNLYKIKYYHIKDINCCDDYCDIDEINLKDKITIGRHYHKHKIIPKESQLKF